MLLPPRGAALCGLAAGLAPPGGPCKAQGRGAVRRSKLALAALAALVKSSSAALVVPHRLREAPSLLLRSIGAPAAAPIPGQKPQQDWRVAVSALRGDEATDESQPFARVQEQLSLRARSSRPGCPGAPAGKPVAHLEPQRARRTTPRPVRGRRPATGRPRGAATMILRRPYLWLTLALSKADETTIWRRPGRRGRADGGRRLAGPPPRLD